MQKYNYVITNDAGQKTKGTLVAPSEKVATQELLDKGYLVISITEDVKVRQWFWEKPHLSFEEKMLFTKHLSTMQKVGITITESMQILRSQATTKNNKKMYENILRMVKSGQTLSQSLREYPGIFTDVFINMIATGEESGTLAKVLEYLDVQLEKEYDLRKKVISAFIYPALIVSITLVLMIGIVFFIMPKVTKIFESFDMVLPLPTRIMIGMSKFITEKPLMTVVSVIGAVVLLVFLFKAKFLKPFWHRIILYLPVFGKLFRYVSLARFSRTMNSLLVAGVPITRALEISANSSTNHLYKKAILEAAAKVEQGGQFGESFDENQNLVPPLVTRMFYIGEKTGSLELTTEHVAILYERNVDSLTRNLTVLLEPILLVFMAVMVGGIAISIILPIYQLPNIIQS